MNAPDRAALRLTQFSHGGGCGCKIAPAVLQQIVARTVPGIVPKELLVGIETADDAAVYQVSETQAIVATTDFFTPIVDDPFDFGAIAATNALSDIYAMGASPLFALALVGMPVDRLPVETIRRVLEGGEAICAKAGIPVADIASGMYAFSSVLAALLRRMRDGQGATIHVTMLEALGEWMGFPAYFTACGGTAPQRSGAHHATIAPYGPFAAGDGASVFISVQNEREFGRFCEGVLGDKALAADPRFATSPARLANRAALHAEIERVFSALSAGEVMRRLEAADIANARLNGMQDFWDHPQLAARGRWTKLGSPGGVIDALKPPFNLSDFEPRMDAVPALGEHTRVLLAEVGYEDAAIDKLVADGVV